MTLPKADCPIVIAGPCVAESFGMLQEVAGTLVELAQELEFKLVFKASFDKANRSSGNSHRGAGMETTLKWLQDTKARLQIPIITDIHESYQAEPVAAVCDVLQIPAFLCRQTDLLQAAMQTGRIVNVKKGQFLAPADTTHIVAKANAVNSKTKADTLGDARLWLTERGTSFGYGDLVVDMRGLAIMAATGVPVVFDITHSTQRPGGGADGKSSGGARQYAPLLARAAAATGCLSGFFLEVHPNPAAAHSDRETQLSVPQAAALLRQVVPLWRASRNATQNDGQFA